MIMKRNPCKKCKARNYWTGCLHCNSLSDQQEQKIIKAQLKHLKRINNPCQSDRP